MKDPAAPEPWTGLTVATSQRGALLWVPGVLLAAGLALFGMRRAPGGGSLFTRATSARVACGAWRGTAARSAEADRFRVALAAQLGGHGAVSIADSARVATQLASATGNGTDPLDALRALRSLNPHYLVAGTLEPDRGSLAVEVEVWDARSQQCVRRWNLRGASPISLGRAAADSILASLAMPVEPVQH